MFHIRKSLCGAYLFVLKGGNDKVMLWGCGEHSSVIACQSCIAAVRANAGDPDQYMSTHIPGYHWFSLKGAIGGRLGMRVTKAEASDRDQALWDMMKDAPDADTEDRS